MKIGLDIGSTTIKCVVLDDRNNLIYHTYERHYSHIVEKSAELLRRVAERCGMTRWRTLHFGGAKLQLQDTLHYLYRVENPAQP